MRILIVVFLFFSLIACNTDTGTYTLSGTAEGMPDGSEVMIYTIKDNQTKVLDTLTIKNGSFSGSFAKNNEPSIHYMVVNNSSLLYFPESEDLKATIYKDSIQASFVTGNAQNESYRMFTTKMREMAILKSEIAAKFTQAKKDNDNACLLYTSPSPRD